MRTVDLHEVLDVVNGKKRYIETMALNEEDNKMLIYYLKKCDLPQCVRNVIEGNNVSMFVVGVKKIDDCYREPVWQIENAEGKSVTFYFKHCEVKIIGGE